MVEDLGLNLNCDLGVEALEAVRRRRECRFEVGEDEDCRIVGSVVAEELADGDRVREIPGVWVELGAPRAVDVAGGPRDLRRPGNEAIAASSF